MQFPHPVCFRPGADLKGEQEMKETGYTLAEAVCEAREPRLKGKPLLFRTGIFLTIDSRETDCRLTGHFDSAAEWRGLFFSAVTRVDKEAVHDPTTNRKTPWLTRSLRSPVELCLRALR